MQINLQQYVNVTSVHSLVKLCNSLYTKHLPQGRATATNIIIVIIIILSLLIVVVTGSCLVN